MRIMQRHQKSLDFLLHHVVTLNACSFLSCPPDDSQNRLVHIAPANYHILIEPGYASLTTEEAVRFSRPSIDVMFSSAADTYRSETIGVVLTGANEDGASGLAHIVKRGGRALIQDPKTAEIPIMPDAAMRAVPTAEVIPLSGLAPRLIELSREGVKAKRSAAV